MPLPVKKKKKERRICCLPLVPIKGENAGSPENSRHKERKPNRYGRSLLHYNSCMGGHERHIASRHCIECTLARNHTVKNDGRFNTYSIQTSALRDPRLILNPSSLPRNRKTRMVLAQRGT